MYCKGAETAILEKTIAGPVDATLSHINSYAEVCVCVLLHINYVGSLGCKSFFVRYSHMNFTQRLGLNHLHEFFCANRSENTN